MAALVWEQTAAAPEPAIADIEDCTGNLVQIYPLQLDRGMVTLDAESLTLGRGDEVGLVIREDCVSREHARIDRKPGGYVIADLGSTNGTWVNEQRVTSHWLQPGDRVRVGTHIFKFVSANDIETQYHETVYNMMTRDGLTGAWNKRSFLDVIERDIGRASRTGHALTMAIFDIDHFKSINDTYGHLAGDQVLRQLCERIRPLIPQGDLLARYGGEEFAVLLADRNAGDSLRLAETWRMIIADSPFETCEGPVPATISIGLADVASLETDNDPTAEQLIHAADARLYEAKRGGRNRVCV